jgi:hypothetical protein
MRLQSLLIALALAIRIVESSSPRAAQVEPCSGLGNPVDRTGHDMATETVIIETPE